MGLLFVWFIGRDVYARSQVRSWKPVEAVIVESRIVEEPKASSPYRLRVRYVYSWREQQFNGDRWSWDAPGFSEYRKAQKLVERYAVDTKVVCYVNPDNPSEALLERPTVWIALFVFLPLIFVGIGGGSLVLLWRRSKATAAESSLGENVRPKSVPARSVARFGPAFGMFFFGLFAVIGGVAGYFLWRPLMMVQAAKGWPAQPCTVISSRVQTHSGSDSTTYSVDILYAYEVNGREYKSNRYKFMGGSSSGWASKAAIVQRYREGSKAVCYVNPADPTEAVLERGYTADIWLGAIPLVFITVGLVGGIASWRAHGRLALARASREEAGGVESTPIREIIGSDWSKPVRSTVDLADPSAAKVLKPSSSRLAAFIFLVIFSAIWNGVLFFGFLGKGALTGHGSGGWFGTLFLLPFLTIGIVMLGVTVYQLLALSNPKAELRIQPGVPALGASLEISWRLSGRVHVLRGLKLFLQGREEATYRQGTRTQTDRQTFLTLQVASLDAAADLGTGQARVILPADSVPSFRSANHRIVWAIEVLGDIPRWPDLKEEFEIQVRPGARTDSA